jgi:hypothetical protein
MDDSVKSRERNLRELRELSVLSDEEFEAELALLRDALPEVAASR